MKSAGFTLRDKKLAQLAFHKNLLTKNQLDQCLDTMRQAKPPLSFVQVLLKLKYLNRPQLHQLLSQIPHGEQDLDSPQSQKAPSPKEANTISPTGTYYIPLKEEEEDPINSSSFQEDSFDLEEDEPPLLLLDEVSKTSPQATEDEDELELIDDYGGSKPHKAPILPAKNISKRPAKTSQGQKGNLIDHTLPKELRMDLPKGGKTIEDFSSWGADLQSAFTVPLSSSGLVAIFSWWAFTFVAAILTRFLMIFAIFFALWFWANWFLNMYEIVQFGAGGEKKIPPISFSMDIGELANALFLNTAAMVLCSVPTLIFLYLNFPVSPVRFGGGMLGYLYAFIYAFVSHLSNPLLWIFMILGAFFYPMSILSVAIFRSIDSLNPLFLAKSIFSVIDKYLVVCGIFYMLIFGVPFVFRIVLYKINPYSVFLYPVVGFYLIIVEYYLLGLIYKGNREKLGW